MNTGKGGGARHGTVPGNDDWTLWRSGGRVGEARTARFLAGFHIDSYGLFPARFTKTDKVKVDRRAVLESEEGSDGIRKKKMERMPPNYDSAAGEFACQKRKSFSTTVIE